MRDILEMLGERFGVLVRSGTARLTVAAGNRDVAVGDLFVIPSVRGHERFYIFRAGGYANVLSRTVEPDGGARGGPPTPRACPSYDLSDERLLELRGSMLGYAEKDGGVWQFCRPRRLPDQPSDVYLAGPSNSPALRLLLGSQLGGDGIFVGHLLAGESPLPEVPVFLPPGAISQHIGIFGRTGCGKSNTVMVLIQSVLRHNKRVHDTGRGQRVSMFAADPHDEFLDWHRHCGGRGGLRELAGVYGPEEAEAPVAPFFYLTPRRIAEGDGMARLRFSRADLIPEDLMSVTEFTGQQSRFAQLLYSLFGEEWVGRLLSGDLGDNPAAAQYPDEARGAVERRVSFLNSGQTKVFTRYDPELGFPYDSLLPELVCSLEKGRVVTVDTTLLPEQEQFLLTALVARVLFTLRKALVAARGDAESLKKEIALAFGVGAGVRSGAGSKSLAEALLGCLDAGELPYLTGEGAPVSIDALPHVGFLIGEAPGVLNPERVRFGSVFRDISRQGRRFQLGLTVVSQLVTAIDRGILTQINTELTMALGNETERREAIRGASADLYGFEKELRVMGKGQALLTASYKDVPLPVQVPLYDAMGD